MESMFKILIAEHELHDIELIQSELKKSGLNYITEVAANEETYCGALKNFIPDVILCDYTFPSFDGPRAFKIKMKFAPDTPFLIVSGTIGEENSIELFNGGITDFVQKDKLFTLNIKLKRALKQAKETREKKLAEKSLIESEARLVEAQALANIGSWQTELADMSVSWSRETYRIFNMEPREFHLTHSNFLEFIHPDDLEELRSAFDISLHQQNVNLAEHRIITANGTIKTVEERWRIVHDETGRPIRAIGTCQDITERKKQELHIKASEERFRMLFEQNLAGFYQSGKDGVILNCNIAFATMLGYGSPDELIGTNANELYFSLSDRNDFVEDIISKKKLSNYETILKHKDGEPRYFLENIMEHTDPITGGDFFDGVIIDITERKKTEREIAWMINNTEESFILLNKNLEISSFNEKAYFLHLKYFFQKLEKGRNILDYAQPERLEILKKIYADVLGGIVITDEIIIPLPDHTKKHFALKYKPAADGEGIIIGAFVSALDMTEQKNAEQLKEFESLEKEALINTTTDLIWSVTGDFRLIAANRAFINSLKELANIELKPGDDLLAGDHFPKAFISMWKEYYMKALGGASFTKEVYRPAFNLQPEAWAETSFNPIYNGDKIIGIACYTRDTTASKLIQTRLESINQKLEAAQQIAKLGYWEQNLKADTLYWSDEVYKIWGVSPGTYSPDFTKFYGSIHPDDLEKFDRAQKASLDGYSKLDVEHRIILPDGSVKHVHEKAELIYNDMKELFLLEGTVQDITERKNSEAALHEGLMEKNNILESIGDAFFAVDKNFTVTYWNRRAQKMLGKRPGETIGKNLWEILPYSIGSDSRENYLQAMDTDTVVRFEDYYQPLRKWHEVSAYPSSTGLSVYFRDVTERKHSESRLNELNVHLEKTANDLALSNAELEQFAYVASHDLQEPLRMVTSFLGLLEKKYGDKIDDKGRTYIDFAVNGAKHMRSIILDLLEFSRVDAGDEKPEHIDLNKLMEEIGLLFKKDTRENDSFLVYETLPVIHAFRTPLLRVLQNLVGNALKYCRKDTLPTILIKVEDQVGQWLFTVTDNGLGINKEYFEKIFIIFQRLHNKDEYSGTGMGLAITKKIIENKGGRIWVESEEGKGSSFYFTILKQH